MSAPAAYLVGLATLPGIGVLVLAIATATMTGVELQCTRCGYSSGGHKTTPRLIAHVRFRWHLLTTGPGRRCPQSKATA